MKKKIKREERKQIDKEKKRLKSLFFNGLVIVVRSFSTLYDIEKVSLRKREVFYNGFHKTKKNYKNEK